MSDVQKDAEAISRLIKERITPLPQFILKPLQEDGKNLLALEVSPGRSTPYYYKADGVMEAYIRVGNESVIAPDYIVNELILKGTNQSFDTLTTDAVKRITALHFWKQPIWNGLVSALSHPIMSPSVWLTKWGLDQCRKAHDRSAHGL